MIPGLHKALGAFFIDSCDWVVVGCGTYSGLLPRHSTHCTSATLVCLCLRKITKVLAFLMAGSYHRELISEVPCLERPSLAITSKVSSPLSQVASSFSEKTLFTFDHFVQYESLQVVCKFHRTRTSSPFCLSVTVQCAEPCLVCGGAK